MENVIATMPLVFSVREAAAMLGVGRNTVYALVHTGHLSGVRVGRQIRIPRNELFRYLGMEV